MAISSATIKKMKASAQTLNTNGGSKSSTSSSGSKSSTSSKSSSSSSNTSSKYTIGSDAGKNIAKNMQIGETYNASDGSTWKKENDGSVTVTHNGKTFSNAYTSPSQAKVDGVDDVTQSIMNSDFNQSSKVDNADKKTDKAYSNLEKLMNTKDIISDDVWDAINSKFEVPSAVTEADAWLSGQLEKIQSGKTSYSDQVRDMMDKIMNREKFSYDVDTDPLFQQALASAMNSGKQAMQDTIGQASALTGGYGSSYATTAGNQAYNAFIEDAYDNLPQYYQMAREAYQMEGEEMYRQFGMMSELDDKEFNRNLTAYDATYQHRNQLYNEAYGQYRDSISDAFNIANLQLSEHGQKVNDAYNLYNAASNQADKFYEREYSQWADEVNLAYKYAEMLNSDWQNQANRDFQASESEKNRVWQTAEAEKDRAFTASENAKNRAASRSGGSGGGSGKTSTLTDSQLKTLTDLYIKAGGGDAGYKAADDYLSAIGKNNLSEEATESLIASLNSTSIPTYYQNWTISKDTKNWLGGDDNNDIYTNGTTTMKYKELKKSLEGSGLSKAEQDALLSKWKSQSKK